MFPDELKGLTPVEEKLIALNMCYGFITKYTVPGGQRQSARYPKHIKGHITVFPNNVQELVSNVLPHPLVKVMDDIHVSWQGAEKPKLSDLSSLLSVRRQVVEKALVWLKNHNHLYANIEIDVAEMESWGEPAHGVPDQVYKCLERAEPSAWEKARTGQVVPPTERGLEDRRAVDIGEVLTMLRQGGDAEVGVMADEAQGSGIDEDVGEQVLEDGVRTAVHEITTSGMFSLDSQPDVADAETLRYIHEALGQCRSPGQGTQNAWIGLAEAQRDEGLEPYIVVARGEEFADSIDAHFFARTFPTLFPMGNGGPRLAEENSPDVVEYGDEDVVGNLLSSRNMSLES